MTNEEMKKVFTGLQMAYPSSEMFQADVVERIKFWASCFVGVSPEVMSAAVARYVRKNKYAPSISDIEDELKQQAATTINTAEEWAILINVCKKIEDLRCDFNYTYIPEGSAKSQGQIAREKARTVYENLPSIIKSYIGSYSSLLQFSDEVLGQESTGVSIRRRDYETWRKQNISDKTYAELTEEVKENLFTKNEKTDEISASYDLDSAIQQMNMTVPKLIKKVNKNCKKVLTN